MAKIQEMLSNYTKNKLSSHRFEDDFPTLVHDFIRAHAQQFTPTMPGTVPLLLTALGHQPWKLCYVSRLDLSRFQKLPGDTVAELVRAVVDGNRDFLIKKREKNVRGLEPLELLDVSFNRTVTPDHVARILDMTRLGELRIWDNPGLAGAASDKRIAKLTNRERFLESFQRLIARQAERRRRRTAIRIQPTPPMGPGPARIRQLVWTTLETDEDKEPTSIVEYMRLPPPKRVSLAQLDADRLSWILHPRFHQELERVKEEVHVFAETVAFPLHDVWAPLDEVYTSAARFEKTMTTSDMINRGRDIIDDRWPLKLPLLMATGCESDSRAITSPFPETFTPAWVETLGDEWFQKRMRQCGFDAIEPGEFTLMFLHEPDFGLVHYAIVTRRPDGQLDVRDPGAAAREAGDEKAAQAWERGFPEQEEGEEPKKRYAVLDADAVEKMLAASTTLATRRNRINHCMYKFLGEREEEREAAAAELQRRIAEQETKTESGCKRPKSEDLDGDSKAEPEAKRIKKEGSDE
ncbi:hypothetical protein F5883DRAFT_592642 [Diaporthe sp. PMI_573]|nr:hypothetical protein F5883DRAFT_592642 [Diaporthaceae sp. PMI_573]